MKTTTVETSKLSGAALDWAVAKALGWLGWVNYPSDSIERGKTWHMDPGTTPFGPVMEVADWRPSTDWSQAGPLIDEYDVGLVKMEYGDWCAAAYCTEVSAFNDTGPTPLIAAMRAIVAAKLGDDVEVPAELVEASNA